MQFWRPMTCIMLQGATCVRPWAVCAPLSAEAIVEDLNSRHVGADTPPSPHLLPPTQLPVPPSMMISVPLQRTVGLPDLWQCEPQYGRHV